MKQMYEQLPQIKQYITDSYLHGELGQRLRIQPTTKYIETKINKRFD
jgi:hypothetical protein